MTNPVQGLASCERRAIPDRSCRSLRPSLGQSPFNIYNPVYGQTAFYLNPLATNPADLFVPVNDIPILDRATETQIQRGIYIQD